MYLKTPTHQKKTPQLTCKLKWSRCIDVCMWLRYHGDKRSWSTERTEVETYGFHLSIQLQISRSGLVKGQPCLTDVSHGWKNSFNTCFSSSQVKYQGEGSRREGVKSWRQDWSMKLFPDTQSAGHPPCCGPGPQGLEQDCILPFSINVHIRMQTNIEMRTFLKLPTKPDANLQLYL